MAQKACIPGLCKEVFYLLPSPSPQKVSNKVVPDLNENMGRLTNFAQKWYGSADLHTPIHPPPKKLLNIQMA